VKGTVTIAATYGAGGSLIAPAVAKRLGLPFVERAIPVEVAERLAGPLQAALAEDTAQGSAVGRVLDRILLSSGLFVGVAPGPEVRGVDRDVAHTEIALRACADAGGAVILGRAGVFALKGRADVLHVRLDGDVEARRRAAMRHEGIDYATATRQQQHTDQARRAYVEHFYPRAGAWEDPRQYHLVLDSTAMPVEACVDLIARAAEDLFRSRGDST
jgi:cytidylate kinase